MPASVLERPTEYIVPQLLHHVCFVCLILDSSSMTLFKQARKLSICIQLTEFDKIERIMLLMISRTAVLSHIECAHSERRGKRTVITK